MKVVFITDTHVGARGGSAVFRELFRSYYRDILFPYLKENNIKVLCHTGDFFDDRSKLSLLDIDFILNDFLPLLEEYDVHLYVVAGNHDVAYKNTNRISSLTMLTTSPRVTVILDEVYKVPTEGKYSIYLCPWLNPENSERLIEEIKTYASKDAIIGGHFEINGALMYKNSKACEHGQSHNLFKNYHKALSGHFHHSSTYGKVEYIGALFHYNWQDWNDWRGFTVFDTESGEIEKVENEYCLFHQYDYEEISKVDKKDLPDYVEGKIVRIQIFDEYNKIELKDLLQSIEQCKPVSVGVIDNTIVEQVVVDKEQEVDDTKEVSDYFITAIDNLDIENKQSLTQMFEDLYERARLQMREIE